MAHSGGSLISPVHNSALSLISHTKWVSWGTTLENSIQFISEVIGSDESGTGGLSFFSAIDLLYENNLAFGFIIDIRPCEFNMNGVPNTSAK